MNRLPPSRAIFVLCLVMAAATARAQDLKIYDDVLQNGFLDYSYGGVPADFDFASTAEAHGGSKSIAFMGDDFNAVSFARPAPAAPVTTAQYPTLHFWVHGGVAGGQQLRIYLQLNGSIVKQAELDSYIAGGVPAAGAWREVTVALSQAPLSYSGSFDRIDLQSDVGGTQPVLYLDDVTLLAGGLPAANLLLAEHDVTVDSMVSDRFTWHDSADKLRVAVLAHNDGQLGPTVGYPNHGGALREFRYQMPNGLTRIADTTTYGNGAGGFGYVVSHRGDGTSGIGGADDSPLGYAFTGSFQRVFEGRHHAIFRFTQLYPRYSSTTATPPNHQYMVPVTIEWTFATGRDNPVWSVTWDLSGVPVDALNDDSRAPYGELNIDGQGFTDIDGVAWGDRYKFTSTLAPVTLDSTWTWNTPNTVPYVKLWIAGVPDATMGTVLTQTMTQQDAGGGRDPFYHDLTAFWGKTSADGNAGGANKMPWQNNWPYQANSFSIGPAPNSNNNARLTWGTQYGFLGQSSYVVHDGVVATAPGWPKKSYSTYVVLGPHSTLPVEAQVTQVRTVQSLTLTAAVGSVVASGPAGVGRVDTVAYAPNGYNHVYGALAFAASANALDANIAVSAGALKKPLLIVSNFTEGYPTVKLAGVTLVADVDYFPSLRASANEIWITLNRNLSGATNHLEISVIVPAAVPASLAVDGDSVAGTTSNVNGVLEAGETVHVKPSWRNTTVGSLPAFTGSASSPAGPAGAAYAMADSAASYAGFAAGEMEDCGADCYLFSVTNPATRPAAHWDASFLETLSSSETTTWSLHVGGSFADTPAGSPVYRFVETLLHRGVTAGCGLGNYCPLANVSRQQMAVFLLIAKEGPDYTPPSCVAPVFGDVPCSSGFAPWINELATRQVTTGCGGGNYCPTSDVTRAQMAVFLLRTLEGSVYTPPACVAAVFSDVPCASGFAPWVNELANRGITAGCGSGNYCPNGPNTRGQMAVFLTTTFGLTLYGP